MPPSPLLDPWKRTDSAPPASSTVGCDGAGMPVTPHVLRATVDAARSRSTRASDVADAGATSTWTVPERSSSVRVAVAKVAATVTAYLPGASSKVGFGAFHGRRAAPWASAAPSTVNVCTSSSSGQVLPGGAWPSASSSTWVAPAGSFTSTRSVGRTFDQSTDSPADGGAGEVVADRVRNARPMPSTDATRPRSERSSRTTPSTAGPGAVSSRSAGREPAGSVGRAADDEGAGEPGGAVPVGRAPVGPVPVEPGAPRSPQPVTARPVASRNGATSRALASLIIGPR